MLGRSCSIYPTLPKGTMGCAEPEHRMPGTGLSPTLGLVAMMVAARGSSLTSRMALARRHGKYQSCTGSQSHPRNEDHHVQQVSSHMKELKASLNCISFPRDGYGVQGNRVRGNAGQVPGGFRAGVPALLTSGPSLTHGRL